MTDTCLFKIKQSTAFQLKAPDNEFITEDYGDKLKIVLKVPSKKYRGFLWISKNESEIEAKNELILNFFLANHIYI